MWLTNAQKAVVFTEIDKVKAEIKELVSKGKINPAANLINRRLNLKRLLRDDITVTKFISTLTTEKTKKYYTKLLNHK